MNFTSNLEEPWRSAGFMETDSEEQMRRAAFSGHIGKVKELINSGFDINTRLPKDGCTPLMLACSEGHEDLAAWLLEYGADPQIREPLNGDTAYSMCRDTEIKNLFIKINNARPSKSIPPVHNSQPNHLVKNFQDLPGTVTDTSSENELVLKIRVADSIDPDFIEVEIPRAKLSYSNLLALCGAELRTEIRGNRILKLRKLPNTRLRKDKDVQRLKDFDEIEVVINGPAMNLQRTTCSNGVIHSQPIMPTNVYQSISKKDQTILY